MGDSRHNQDDRSEKKANEKCAEAIKKMKSLNYRGLKLSILLYLSVIRRIGTFE